MRRNREPAERGQRESIRAGAAASSTPLSPYFPDDFPRFGVTIGEGVVVGARSSVFGDLPPWKVCTGSPAKPVRDHVIKEPGGPASPP